MDRPVLNPQLFADDPTEGLDSSDGRPRGPSIVRRVVVVLGRAVRRTLRLCIQLLRTRISLRRGLVLGDVDDLAEDGVRPWSRWVRWALFRLTLIPPTIAACVILLVHAATHPPAVRAPSTLAAVASNALGGLYGERVSIAAADGVRSDAWLVPALEARDVLEMRDRVLRSRSPAVVLVHSQGSDGEQLMPLVRPLHEAGMVVLVLNLRGAGTPEPAAQTFGLTESGDVKAAVEMLRRRPFVDKQKIAVVGVGTGASAALLAARGDSELRTLVLDDLPAGPQEATAQILPPRTGLAWLAPVCKWTFELTCKVDADDLDVSRLASVLESRSVLLLQDRPGVSFDSRTVQQIAAFLKTHLAARGQATVASGSGHGHS